MKPMKLPFSKGKEVGEMNLEERVNKLEKAMREGVNSLNQRVEEQHQTDKEQQQRIEEQEKAIASLTDSSREKAEAHDADAAELHEARAEITHLQDENRQLQKRTIDDFSAEEKGAFVVNWFSSLPGEQAAQFFDILRQKTGKIEGEASEEDTAEVAEDVGDPEMAGSLNEVANPQKYVKAEQFGVYIKVE